MATERSKRPHQLKKVVGSIRKVSPKKCPFCPGNEHHTPAEWLRIGGVDSWDMRCFENMYPAVTDGIYTHDSKIEVPKRFSHLFTTHHARGRHEIVVETPQHNKDLCDLSPKKIAQVLDIYAKRIETLTHDSHIKYAAIFKNKGEGSGASIEHTHAQIVAYNAVPIAVRNKADACARYKKKHKRCVYCDITAAEKKGPRIAFENKDFYALCPYASRFQFEVWILPKKHKTTLTELSATERLSCAQILKKVLIRLRKLGAPYNYYIHYAPSGSTMHFHIEVVPRKATFGGFEFATNMIINSMLPERAASFYKTGRIPR